MIEKTKHLRVESESTKPKETLKDYTSPKLRLYGHVGKLTQGGSFDPSPDANTSMMGACERRLKEDIHEIGRHPLGFGLYLFYYKPEYREVCGSGRQFGAMVDEVEKIMPQAVSRHQDGYKMVNYAMLGINRANH